MPPISPQRGDVRMRGFQHRTEPAAVLDLLRQRLKPLGSELVDLHNATGRILAETMVASCSVPGFERAAMGGYALRGQETFGADAYAPLEFEVIGEALPGRPFSGTVASGQAVRIMTGAPLPAGADAVLPAEAAAEGPQGERRLVRAVEPVSPGRHVGHIGEDIQAGQALFAPGRRLRPQDVGVLASIGAATIAVQRRPRVAILVSGDELLPPGARPQGYRIVDSNSVMLEALVQRDGAGALRVQMVKDGHEPVRSALESADEDVILISGGSSVGQEDHAPRVLAELGELLVHGVALRPASPTGVGFLQGRPVFLLPGNPVSCLCAYDLFAGPAIRALQGGSWDLPYRQCEASLAQKIASAIGRTDYVRVRLVDGRAVPLAISGASILSSTTRADGFVLVPGDLEGYAEGATVTVYLYDG